MTSLRAAFKRLTRPNALTYLGLSDADRLTLDIAAAAAKRELRVPYRPLPAFERTARTVGFYPDRLPFDQDARATQRAELAALARPLDVDELARTADLLVLPIVTDTLVGPVEGEVA